MGHARQRDVTAAADDQHSRHSRPPISDLPTWYTELEDFSHLIVGLVSYPSASLDTPSSKRSKALGQNGWPRSRPASPQSDRRQPASAACRPEVRRGRRGPRNPTRDRTAVPLDAPLAFVVAASRRVRPGDGLAQHRGAATAPRRLRYGCLKLKLRPGTVCGDLLHGLRKVLARSHILRIGGSPYDPGSERFVDKNLSRPMRNRRKENA